RVGALVRGRSGRPQCRRSAVAVAGFLGCAVVASCSGVTRGAPAITNHRWVRFVSAPPRVDVTPIALTRTSGEVSGASGLVGGRGTPLTTLTMRSGDPAPVVVVDYGKDIGGVPHLVVQTATGAPTLR